MNLLAWLKQLRDSLQPKPYTNTDVQAMQEAERRRSEIMARLRALEMRYDAATRSSNDVD